MKRRAFMASGAATALASPAIASAATSTLKFIPQADVASLDPVWTTADITRNYSLAVYDTLYGNDADFTPHPQMAAGHTLSSDKRTFTITLRDGLKFHDNTPVTAADCVASLKRWMQVDTLGITVGTYVTGVSAPNDKTLVIKLKQPFALLPSTLAYYSSCIMPAHQVPANPHDQITGSIGSGPFIFKTSERVPGAKLVFEKFAGYVPRSSGKPSFMAGPKVAHFDRVEWTVIPDSATKAGALESGEQDWWENPDIDLISSLKSTGKIATRVTDVTGEIGCLRFNWLYPPFDKPEIRRLVLRAMNQKEVMAAVAGAEPSIIKTDVGIFVPGTPMASTTGVAVTHGVKDPASLKPELEKAGYKGEKITVLVATNFPVINSEGLVCVDVLKKMGFNVELASLDWGTVVQRRAVMKPPAQGGWNIFFTFLGGIGNITPVANIAIRGNGKHAWFGWPTMPEMQKLLTAWLNAPDVPAQQKICEQMQQVFWKDVPYVPLGMYQQPTAYRTYLKDIRMGFPQMYGVRRV
ncbi:MAG: ABC transporter substrate-binding protein [Rhodospirillales bacterium]|nr:ABC transporter substrate-binding protein [Rhodospirillales bacterium]